MTKESDKKIEIGKVEGDVIISQNQTGGVTSHSFNNTKRKRNWTIASIIFLLAAIVTILTWIGVTPKLNSDIIVPKSNNTHPIIDTSKKTNMINNKIRIRQENKMDRKKIENPINIEKVGGDVVISQNQSGGQVAHTINNYGPTKRTITSEIKAKMLVELKKYSGQKIGFASTQGDMEAADFKNILINVFREGGWNVVDRQTFMFFGEQKGCVVTIPFKSSENGIPQVVAQILSLTGNPVSGNRGDMANDCEIYVQVWHNPQ